MSPSFHIVPSALLIVTDHSFFLWDQRLSGNIFLSALNHYEGSSHCEAVRQAVGLAYDQLSKQKKAPREIELSFELQLKEIVMNHRLCKLIPLLYSSV